MYDMLLEYENAWSIHSHCKQRRFQPTSYILPLLVSEESVAATSSASMSSSHKESIAVAAAENGDTTVAGTVGADMEAPLVLPTTAGEVPLSGAGEHTIHGLTTKPPVTMLVPCRDLVTRPMGVSLSRSGKEKNKDHVEEGEEGRRVPFRARKKPVRGANPARLLPPIGATAGAGVVAVFDGEGVQESEPEGVITENNGEIVNVEVASTGDGNDTTDAVDKKPPAINPIAEEEDEDNQMATLPLRQKAVPSLNNPSSTVLVMEG